MLLAAVSFIPQMDHEEGELVLVAEDYLTALVKNGQIHGNFVSGWVDGVYTAYVHVSHRDAHKADATSQWVRRTEKLVRLQYGVSPEWLIVDDETSLPVPQLSSAGFLYLMTHAVHEGSPVWHGQRGTCLPMPLLPVSDRLKEELYHWALLCRNYDQIWTMDGPLAESAWHQLSSWQSELYCEARRLADQLQSETNTHCFVYLWNDFPDPLATVNPTSQSAAEGSNPQINCPGCGNDWDVDRQQIPSREPFRKFHFRCNDCRIVTHEPQVAWQDLSSLTETAPESSEQTAQPHTMADASLLTGPVNDVAPTVTQKISATPSSGNLPVDDSPADEKSAPQES